MTSRPTLSSHKPTGARWEHPAAKVKQPVRQNDEMAFSSEGIELTPLNFFPLCSLLGWKESLREEASIMENTGPSWNWCTTVVPSISQVVLKVYMKKTVCHCAPQTPFITEAGAHKLPTAEWIKVGQYSTTVQYEYSQIRSYINIDYQAMLPWPTRVLQRIQWDSVVRIIYQTSHVITQVNEGQLCQRHVKLFWAVNSLLLSRRPDSCLAQSHPRSISAATSVADVFTKRTGQVLTLQLILVMK